MNAPYAPQDVSEVSGLVKSLEACTKKGGGGKHSATSKKHTYDIGNGISVDSWQFKEWDYKRRDLPTYARGLFTYRKRDGTPEIAVRGYDKFFNVGEVRETNWEHVENQTRGPYELSVKENGCIIFLAGLEGDNLLVCSKHSTGARQDADLSHAVAGEKWVDRHLSTMGKTRSDLARELRRRNVTAVAELCDDQFEEHVLAYEPKDAGLYLHGMNLNLPEFATYPGELVHTFADEWGFKKAQYLMKDDVESMRRFLSQCAETGSYAGRDTEGFVIRCEYRKHGTGGGYHNWFFKYKFEEPYLMYRQWRECTKQLICGKPPKYKKHKKITEEYLNYARRELSRDPSLGKAYNQNHGIIAMRDGFLRERGLKGSEIIRLEQGDEEALEVVTNNVVLLTVASIGCGKTTVALALTRLFNWGHVQNDNITGKQNRPKQFTTQICNSLANHPVCIGDRNNHQKRERKQIIDDVLSIIPEAKFVALQYVHDPKHEMLPSIRRITQERIFARGDNHQTIQAGSKSRQEITSIMEGFLNRFEPVNTQSEPDNAFDEVINLDVALSSRENLETVVSFLHNHYPRLVKAMPAPSQLDNAIEAALNDYKPDIKHDLSFKSKKALNKQSNGSASHQEQHNGSLKAPNPPKLEYFCIKLQTSTILSTLAIVFSNIPTEAANFYHHLQKSRRIQPSFHLTLMHRASIPSHPELWQHLSSLHANAVTQAAQTPHPTFDPILGKCRVRLERVVWDDRLMCIVARLLDEGWQSVNEVAHVTVGTARDGIKPKESNDLLSKWLASGSGVQEKDIEGFMEVHGDVRAVMQNTR
ncbi:MAG: hypothetical protein Q9163_000773 [Psora crenata]